MKRFLLVVFALLIAVTALGESSRFDGITVEKAAKDPAINAGMIRNNADDKGIFDKGSTDIVTIGDDGSYFVNAGQVEINLLPPFGWFCFTQDLVKQWNDYSTMFNDPAAINTEMINQGMHYLLIDSGFSAMVEIYINEDALSKMIVNSNDLDSSDQDAVLQIISDISGEQATALKLGDKVYYLIGSEDKGLVIYETVINGVNVDIYVRSMQEEAISAAVMEEIKYMIEDSTIN